MHVEDNRQDRYGTFYMSGPVALAKAEQALSQLQQQYPGIDAWVEFPLVKVRRSSITTPVPEELNGIKIVLV